MNSKPIACITVITLLLAPAARAGDVVTDGTIGTAPSTTLTLDDLDGDTVFDTFNIVEALGERSGTNLFHSFLSFNIDPAEIALFSEDAAGTTTNVISRVTGGSASLLNGTIRNIPGANFWFVNTAGVMIGANAVFDVSGALAIGAVDYVELSDGGRYYALPAGEDISLLNVNPVDFGFLDPGSTGTLTVTDLTLDDTVSGSAAGDVTLAGGSVSITGTSITNKLEGNSGGSIRVQAKGSTMIDQSSLIATADSTVIDGDVGSVIVSGATIAVSDSVLRADATEIDSTAGLVALVAGNGIDVDGSTLTATSSRRGTDATGLDVGSVYIVNGSGDITLIDSTLTIDQLQQTPPATSSCDTCPTPPSFGPGFLSLSTPGAITSTNTNLLSRTSGGDRAGTIVINAASFDMDGGSIETTTVSLGAAGNIAIAGFGSAPTNTVAADSVSLANGAAIRATAGPAGSTGERFGNAGSIRITATNLSTNAATIESAQRGTLDNTGAAGTISLAGGVLTLTDSTVSTTTSGNNTSLPASGGRIALNAGSQLQLQGTDVLASTSGAARAGDIAMASPLVDVSGGSLQSSTSAVGPGGAITVNWSDQNEPIVADTVVIRDGALFSARSTGTGDAGFVIVAADSVSVENADLQADATEFDTAAGFVALVANSGIDVTGSTLTATSASARADVGNLDLTLGSIYLLIDSFAPGSGDITITDSTLTIDQLPGVITAASCTGGCPPDLFPSGFLKLSTPNDLTLTNANLLSRTSGLEKAGNIVIEAANLSMAGGSIQSSTVGRGDAGNISIAGPGSLAPSSTVAIGGGADIRATAGVEGGPTGAIYGAAGDISIGADTITLAGTAADRVGVSSSAFAGAPRAGTITLTGTDLSLSFATLATETAASAGGAPASVTLDFGNGITAANSVISAASTGPGAAGSIDVIAGAGVQLTATTVQSSSVGMGVGPAGSVRIAGNELSFVDSLVSTRTSNDTPDVDGPGAIDLISNRGMHLDGTTIETVTTGLADAGDIAMQALGGDIDIDNDSLVTVSTAGGGDAGDVTLTASGDINLRGGSQVDARSTAAGDAGSVLLDATGAILIDGSSVSSESAGIGVGTAGDIDMTAQNITLRGALVSTQSSSDSSDPGDVDGPPGTIKLTAARAVLMENGSLTSASVSGAANGGAVVIKADDLTLSQGSVIETRATGDGNSGSVALDIGNDLTLETPGNATNPNQQSAILTNSLKSEGGDITAEVDGVLFMQRGRIESSVETAAGSGGDIRITANGLFMAGSQVLARADQGNGGTIFIRRGTRVPDPATDTLFDGLYIIDSESLINADSNTGVDGDVNVDAPDADLTGVVEVVDARIAIDPTLADDVCSPTFRQVQSSFIVEDEGGVAPAPDGYFSAGIATDAGTVSSASGGRSEAPLLIASAGGCP